MLELTNVKIEDRGIKNISFTVKKGYPTALVGLVGSGKTSIFDAIAGLIDWYGIIRDMGQNGNIGYVTQEPIIFQGTVKDNLDYVGLDWRKHIFCHRIPFSVEVGERGQKLSGGQRQLLSLTRIQAGDPKIWLLDEPTSAMDNEINKEAIDWILSQACGKIILLATHKLENARRFSQILVLHKGIIAESGSHDSLMKNNGPYRRLWDVQEIT